MKCLFDYPIQGMPKTMVLDPLEDVDDEKVNIANDN